MGWVYLLGYSLIWSFDEVGGVSPSIFVQSEYEGQIPKESTPIRTEIFHQQIKVIFVLISYYPSFN